ncbi:MAG: isoprenylcysteine carboxylmethyltransferase family protein [candidate division WOR-3 bacterium]
MGHWLFRWRGVIGAFAFIIVYFLSSPTISSCRYGLLLLLFGLAWRFWAVGHIGKEVRARVIGAREIVRSGPYRFFPHPIYAGNFLLVLGMLWALNPPVWLWLVVLAGFFTIYGLIARAEEQYLKDSNLPVVEKHFSCQEALSEASTWLAVTLAYLLTLAKAFWLLSRQNLKIGG